MNYYNYFTEIEEHFVRRRGKHLFVSPMDWSLMATWRDSGVPLHVALRGIDRAMDGFLAKQPRGHARVNTLFYCHSAVMEEYTRHLESHLGEEPASAGGNVADEENAIGTREEHPDKKAILEFLNARILEIKSLPTKLPPSEEACDGMARLRGRIEEIVRDVETNRQVDCEALDRDLAILDETLVGELRKVLTVGQIAEWEQEAKKELKIYRKKLPKDTYEKILGNFMRARVHRQFHVGELSLFYM